MNNKLINFIKMNKIIYKIYNKLKNLLIKIQQQRL